VILPDSDENTMNKMAFLFDVIKRYDHYIGTTNFKVGLMMSFLGTIILGLVIRVMLLTPAQGGSSCMYIAVIIFAVLTILCAMVAAINLLMAVFPNTKNSDNMKSLIFFGDVSTCENGSEGYFEKIKNSEVEGLLKDLSTQTYTVAGIVSEKFRILKKAVNIIIYAVMPLLAITLLLLIAEGIK
jgi:hypothetical protein